MFKSQIKFDAKFEILKEIGAGRYGSVYKVRNRSTHEVMVVKTTCSNIKKMKAAEAEKMVETIQNEFKLLSHLDHPNVVKVYDFAISDSGQPYYSMEYLDGLSLREHYDFLRANSSEMQEVIRQICLALTYIHNQGIIHGDLKPENILIKKDGKKLVVKISDFGLAEIMAKAEVDDSIPVLRGTYPYMSPEMICARKTDHRSDLYSLGVILYEMTTGQNPFVHDSPQAIISAHLNKHPESPTQVNPQLNSIYDSIIMQLLAKEPSFRPSTAQEVAIILQLEVGELIEPPPMTAGIFVGQHLPWKEVQNSFEQTCQGRGSFVLVTGAEGIGKSRFFDEVKANFQLSGAVIIEARLSSSCESGYDAFRKILTDLKQINKRMTLDLLKLIYPQGDSEQVELATDEKTLNNSMLQAAHLFLNLMKVREDETAESPVIIMLRDFHNEEIYPWLFFRELAIHWEESCPEGVYCMWMIESRSNQSRSFISGHAPARFQMTEMVALTNEETGILLSSLLGVTPVPQEIVDKVHTLSGGNPLLINFLAQAIHRAGAIEWRDTSWRINLEKAETIELTDELFKLSRIQIQSLPSSLRTVMNHASLWPRPFTMSELKITLPDDAGSVFHIKKLILGGMLSKEVIDNDSIYSVRYPAIQSVLHDSIPAYERVNLHLQLAENLSRKSGCSKSDLAYHLLAGDNRIDGCEIAAEAAREFASQGKHRLAVHWFERAINEMPDRNRSKIAQLNYELAQNKYMLHEYSAVIELMEGAESILESRFYQKREKALFLHLLGSALKHARQYKRAEKVLEEAIEFLPKTTALELRLKILSLYSEVLIDLNQFDKALEIINSNLESLPLSEYPYYSGLLLAALTQAQYSLGRYADAEISQKRSIEYGEMVGSSITIIDRYMYLGMIYESQGRFRDALQEYEKVISLARKGGDPRNLSHTMILHATLKMHLEPDSSVEQTIQEALEIAERIGSYRQIILAMVTYAQYYVNAGKIDKAQSYLLKSLSYVNDDTDLDLQRGIYVHLSSIEHRHGNWSAALKYFDRLVAVSRKLREPVTLTNCYIRMTMTFIYMQNWKKAAHALHKAKCYSRLSSQKFPDIDVLSAEIKFRSDDINSAMHIVKNLINDPNVNFRPNVTGNAYRLLGVIYHKQGSLDKSRNSLVNALKIFESTNNVYEIGITRYHFADLFITQAEMQKAHTELMLAKDIFKRLSATYYLDLIEKTLAELSKPRATTQSDHNQTLIAFEQISGLINSITDTKELLERILDVAIRSVNAERGVIILIDEESKKPKVASLRNLDSITSQDACLISSTVLAETTNSDTALMTGDAPSDPRFSTIKSVRAFNILSLICVPMRLQRKLIGAIYVDSRRLANLFTEKDRRFLETFADLSAITIERSTFYQAQADEKEILQREVELKYRFDNLIGKSKSMLEIYHQLGAISRTDVPVLITGKSGTGKELAARAIHYNSYRKGNRFVPVNCAAIPETLIESEFFGYVKGAFTDARHDKPGRFEFAEGGTLFLDEIAEIPPAMQSKLLRAIETKEILRLGDEKTRLVDIRIIAATNKDLRAEIQAGRFREDLYYRLRVAHIIMPDLKDRPDDIPLMAEYFLQQACKRTGRHFTEFNPKTFEALIAYPWPGNVRELEHAIESAVVFGTPPSIQLKDLPQEIRIPFAKSGAAYGKPELRSLEEVEEAHIRAILASTGGNKLRACQVLNISRPTLDRKLEQYNINIKKIKYDV